jgi:cell cycle sensor histidine kinase DivJ
MRHQAFIVAHLAVAGIGLTILPLDLAIFGVPTLGHMAVYAGLLVPVLAVIFVSRTGRLVEAHAICGFAMVAMALVVASRGGSAFSASYLWLLLAPLEAALSFSVPLVVATGLASIAGILVLGALHSNALIPVSAHAPGLSDALFAAPPMAVLLVIALTAMRLHEARRRMARIGAANFDSLSGALGDLVLRHDRGGAVLYASRESERLFNLPARELMGRGMFERIHVADRPAFLKAISDAADGDEPVAIDIRLRKSSVASQHGDFDEPVFVWVELRARGVAVDSADHHRTDGAAVIAVVRDVSSAKQHEAQLEAARIEAEEANLWKDRFLANVSHELRTPLNAIIGFSEMLGNDELMPRDAAKRKEYADIIHGSGEHLLSVVNSILDMSKIDAGRFEIVPEPFEVAPLIDQCVDMVRLKAEESSVRIIRDVPARLDELVADKRACKQILINLLSNAVKFTPMGGAVSVRVRLEGNSMVFCVADTGIGIQPRDLARIGEPFFQARDSYDRPYEGTGLGLSVVRGLVGLHGGAISIESELGQGTQVTVRLPLDCRRIAARPAAAKIEAIARRPAPADENSLQPKVKKIA